MAEPSCSSHAASASLELLDGLCSRVHSKAPVQGATLTSRGPGEFRKLLHEAERGSPPAGSGGARTQAGREDPLGREGPGPHRGGLRYFLGFIGLGVSGESVTGNAR